MAVPTLTGSCMEPGQWTLPSEKLQRLLAIGYRLLVIGYRLLVIGYRYLLVVVSVSYLYPMYTNPYPHIGITIFIPVLTLVATEEATKSRDHQSLPVGPGSKGQQRPELGKGPPPTGSIITAGQCIRAVLRLPRNVLVMLDTGNLDTQRGEMENREQSPFRG
ncbi:hypothetical protein WISP_57252 [Willisornis vidua]|uniref:Uncharacterized protein n=1 Tax=Willisornis vidua TaxID=1566151 RepID=A0ABQ9DHE3_9PASS|nr:hypothetical protein WISP_57252 [Willisornis vidua]